MPSIEPKVGVINTFRNQKTEIQFAIGEFVDNSIDSYFKNKEELEELIPSFKPYIDITFDTDENMIVVEDNCAGIHKEDEERAFSIGEQNPNSIDIGTYGMGMKVSAFWFSPQWDVVTKPMNENCEKTFSIELEDILITGKTKDKVVESDSDPFTRITLKDVYAGRLPVDTKKLADVQKYLFEMYRFMILDHQITIKFNGRPLERHFPKIFKERYIKEKKGEKKEWLTALPEFDLGEVKRNGKKVKLKTLGGAAYIKEKGSNKDQKGFSIFWKNRLVDGHQQKPWMPGTRNYEESELQIYGANNQYKAQRLEGYILLSPDFNVPSTKDGVDWEGTEETLIKKLKKYLENAEIKGENSKKKYDFLEQCNKIADLNKTEEEDNPDDTTGLPPTTTIYTPPDEPKGGEKPDDKGFFNSPDLEELTFLYNDTSWNVKVNVVKKENEKLYSIFDGPHGSKDDKKREIGIKINLGHPFIRGHFYQIDLKEQKKGVIRLCIALALAESISSEITSNRAQNVRLKFLEIINTFSEEL